MIYSYSKLLTNNFLKAISFTLILIAFAPQTQSLSFKDKYKVIFNGHEIATLRRYIIQEDTVVFQFYENIMKHSLQTSPSGYRTIDDIESLISLKTVEQHQSTYWKYLDLIMIFEEMLLCFFPAYEIPFQRQERSDNSADSYDYIEENIDSDNNNIVELFQQLYDVALDIIATTNANIDRGIHGSVDEIISRTRHVYIGETREKYNRIRRNIKTYLLMKKYSFERLRRMREKTFFNRDRRRDTESGAYLRFCSKHPWMEVTNQVSFDAVNNSIRQALDNLLKIAVQIPSKYDCYIFPDQTRFCDLSNATFYFRMHVVDEEGRVTNRDIPLQPIHNEHLIDDDLPQSHFPYMFIRRLIGRNKTECSLVHHTFSDENKNYEEYRGTDYVEYRIYLNEKHREERTKDYKSEFYKKYNAGYRWRRPFIYHSIPADREVNVNSNGDRELLVCGSAHGNSNGGSMCCDFHTASHKHSVYEGPACVEPHEEHSDCEMDCKKPPSIPNRGSALQTILQALASNHDTSPEQIRYLFFFGETMARYFNELVNDQSSQGAMVAPEQIAVFDSLSSTSSNIIGAYQVFVFDQQTNMIHQRDSDNDPHPSHVTTDYQLSEDCTQVVRITITDANPTLSSVQVLVFDATEYDSLFDVTGETAGFDDPDDGISAIPVTPSSSVPLNTTEEDVTGSDELRLEPDEFLLRELPFYPSSGQ
ncbi:hypothetical protein [Endozoicomonas sp. Mp262]|uniref:hypothetical protein n=1 Tax=Endozoicomonas sp. Mp262 TaxID=2919499 RepID=UPI0021D99226